MSVSRRHFFFGSLALPVFAAKKPTGERPNLVLILVDGVPSWMLGSSGNQEVKTPNLDRLAQTGTSFTRHSVATAQAALSRATVLTGRTPMQLGDADSATAGDSSLTKVFSGLGYAAQVADSGAAGAFVDQQSPGKPFFLTVGCPALRAPYDGVAPKYRDLYAQTRFETFNLDRQAAPNAKAGKEMLADQIGNLRKVAAAISALDEEVGVIMSKLSQRRLMDQTLVVFTSTCGGLYGRHGLWDASAASDPPNMYEEAVTTPLFWSWTGHVPAQAIRPELVSTYDFVPTICDLVAADLPISNLCGRSYLLLATGKPLPKKEPWRTTVFGHYQNTDMARIERYKLVSRDNGKGPGELYDMQDDYRERINQYNNPQFMTVRGPLADRLAMWKQSYSR